MGYFSFLFSIHVKSFLFLRFDYFLFCKEYLSVHSLHLLNNKILIAMKTFSVRRNPSLQSYES